MCFTDGIDGKQARRTGTSGPLGELFDHGLDSWTTFFIPACIWSVFGRVDYSITPLRFYFVLWNVITCFYVSHWEKYLTKILFLPWGYDLSQMVSFYIRLDQVRLGMVSLYKDRLVLHFAYQYSGMYVVCMYVCCVLS